MGILTKRIVESKARAVEARGSKLAENANADNLKSKLIESASVALDTEFNKYGNLRTLLESGNNIDMDRAALTVEKMRSQQRYLENAKATMTEATITAGFQNLIPKLLDIVAIFYPEMIQNWVCDAQPIDAQISGVYVLKPIYEDTADGVNAGDEVFRKLTKHASYASERRYKALSYTSESNSTCTFDSADLPLRPGTVKLLLADSGAGTETVVGQDDGLGNIAGDGSLKGTVNYETGVISLTAGAVDNLTAQANVDTEVNIDHNRKIKLKIDNIPVKAEPHILQADYSVESALAANAHLGVNVAEQVAGIMGGELKRERDQRITKLMFNNTTVEDDLKFDLTVPQGISKTVHFADFNLGIDLARSQIQEAMGRGDVDFIIAGTKVTNVISAIPGFVSSNAKKPVGSYFFGTLDNGAVSVVKSFDVPADCYIVGYKGYTTGDSALIVADWIPFYTAPELQLPSMRNQQGVASFYALHVNNKDYWKRSQVTAG